MFNLIVITRAKMFILSPDAIVRVKKFFSFFINKKTTSTLISFVFVFSLLVTPVTTFAANTSLFFANQTISSNGATNGNNGWTSNNQYAVFDSSLDAADYGFPDLGIPLNATIDGIEVIIEGKQESGSGTLRDLTASLWNVSGSNPDAYTSTKTANLTSNDTLITLGNPTDKWGKTWTVSDFADATFKIRIGATLASSGRDASLDAVQVKVYYTPAVTTGSLTVNATVTNDDGGSAVVGDFALKVDGMNISNGVATTTSASAHTVTTTGPSGYTTVFSGDCNASGVVTVPASGSAICTISINDNPTPYVPIVGNLILNPSLESGSVSPINWSNNSYGTNSSTFMWQTGGAHSGSKSAKVVVTGYVNGDAKWIFDPIAVSAGQYYTYTNWYKSDVQTEVNLIYNINGLDEFFYVASLPTVDTWTKFETNFLVPNGATNVRVAHIISGNGTLSTDDYSLVQGVAPVFSEGLVTLTFDDGWKSFYDNGIPVLNSHGLKATAYLNSDPIIEGFSGYMTATDVANMVSQGHDVGGHTKSHVDLTQPGVDLTDQINTNKSYLQGIASPLPISTFAYPYGAYNDTVITHLQGTSYLGARSVDEGYNFTNTDKYRLKIQHVTNTTTIAEVKSWIDTAKQQNAWLIMMFHVIKPGSDMSQCVGDIECTTADFLDQVSNYLVSQNVTVPTMAQGLAIMNGSPIPDTIKPVIAEVTPVANPTNDITPEYVFSSNEAGTITYGGSCSSATTNAVAGNNTISFNVLSEGTYSDCAIKVKDAGNNQSLTLIVSPFTLDTTAPVITVDPYTTTPVNADITVTASVVGGTLNFTSHTFTENGSFDFVATDTAGNVTTETVTVTNIDKTAPVVTVDLFNTNPTNQDITVTVSTNEGTLNFTSHTFTENGSFDFVATDTAGNVTTETVTVTNINKISPVIDSHVDINAEATTSAGAEVLYSLPLVTDDLDNDLVASCSVPSGSIFALGITQVFCDATDSAGNTANQTSFVVTVIDTTPPVVTLNGDNPQIIQAGTSYSELGATVTDNYDTGLSAVIDASSVNTSALGSYTVTYYVTDANLNSAVQVVRTVNVVDTTLPVITMLGNSPETVEVGSVYVDAGATASDNLDGDLTLSILSNSNVDTAIVGSYTVTYDVTDANLNSAVQVVRTVNVVDTAVPTVELLGDNPQIIQAGTSYSELGATVTDNYDTGLSAVIDASSVNTSVIGDYNVTYDVVDNSGNNAVQVVRVVRVQDTIFPVVVIDPVAALTNANPVITFTATDATSLILECSIDGITFVPCTSTSTFSPTLSDGTYVISVRATDSAGNITTETSNSFVADGTAPSINVVVEPSSSINSSTISSSQIVFDVTNALTVECAFDGVSLSACPSSPVSLSAFIEGNHTFKVYALDDVGNISESIVSFSIDFTAPTLSVSSQTTNNVTPTISGTSDDDSSDVSVTVDGLVYTATPVGGNWSITTSTLVDGTYEVSAVSTDSAGNTSVVTLGTLVVNTEAPLLTVDAPSANSAIITGTTEVDSTVVVTVNGVDTDAVVDTNTGLWSADIGVVTPDAIYTVSVKSTDPLTNTAVDNSKTLLIDTTSPSVIQDDITVEATSSSGALVVFAPTVIDTTPGLIAVCNPASGEIFTLGTTLVTCTSNDSINPETSMTFNINVIDTTSPTITLFGNSSMSVSLGTVFVDPGYSVFDLVDLENLISTSTNVTFDGNATSTVETFATSTIPYVITYSATDSRGNSTTTVREVIVSDLVLSEEQSASPSTNSTTITWTTSHPATSRVVWGTSSITNASSTQAGWPNYGYSDSTIEDSTLVTSHSIVVTGLSSGTQYFFRPVSHGSPEVVGSEIVSTTSTPQPAPSGGGGGGGGGGIVTQSSSIRGDANKDGKVNILDFVILMANWGPKNNPTNVADFNLDGRVDILDFVTLMANWSK